MEKSTDLGQQSYDDVDLFGLDEFGQPTGLAPLYGAMIGTGAGTLTAIGVRSFKPEWESKSELVGLLAGVLSGGVMLAFPGTRYAGWVAMASAAVNNGLRAVEQYFRAPATPTKGIGETRVERRQALGIVQAEKLSGLGRRKYGNVPSLMSGGFSNAAAHWGTSPVLMTQA